MGPTQLLIIGVILLLLFGGARISDLGKGLGQGIRNFKRGIAGKRDDDDDSDEAEDEPEEDVAEDDAAPNENRKKSAAKKLPPKTAQRTKRQRTRDVKDV